MADKYKEVSYWRISFEIQKITKNTPFTTWMGCFSEHKYVAILW